MSCLSLQINCVVESKPGTQRFELFPHERLISDFIAPLGAVPGAQTLQQMFPYLLRNINGARGNTQLLSQLLHHMMSVDNEI